MSPLRNSTAADGISLLCESMNRNPSRMREQRSIRVRPYLLISVVFVIVSAFLTCTLVASPKGDGQIHWKPVERGQVRLDDKQPLKTAVYQPDKSQKKPNLVLILLGHRWLALDIKAKTVYQVIPADLQAQGSDFETGDIFTNDRLVPSKDWSERDVGPGERIRLTLNDYGRALEIMLPHPPDLRAFY